MAIALWTKLVMIPNNFELIRMSNGLGCHRIIASSQAVQNERGLRRRSAEESVDGKGEKIDQFKDTSDPHEQTIQMSSSSQDEKVKVILTRLGSQNFMMAALALAKGIVSFLMALS